DFFDPEKERHLLRSELDPEKELVPRPHTFASKIAFAGLQEIHRVVEAMLALHKMWKSELFSRRRDAYYELLVLRALEVWSKVTGDQDLPYSREAGQPAGPLIDFLLAALKPVLGQALSAERLVWAIKRERAIRRRRHGSLTT